MGNTAVSGYCEEMCPQPCHEQGYVTRLATALWPRESFYTKAVETWKETIPSMQTIAKVQDARTNLAKLEVYFEVTATSEQIHRIMAGN